MIAALPMYWRPETATAWQAFWSRVRDHAQIDLPPLTPPDRLPDDLYAHWRDPDLILSMTCGYPYRTALAGQVTYVGTLDFGLHGDPGSYHSCAITWHPSGEQGNDWTLAYNATDSQSGWAAVGGLDPQTPRPDITQGLETGSHAASLAAVADRRADIAFIDAVTWRLLNRHDPNATKVRLLGRTTPTPGLPLITARDVDPAPLRAALSAACADLPATLSDALGGLKGMTVLDEAAYMAVPDLSPRIASLP